MCEVAIRPICLHLAHLSGGIVFAVELKTVQGIFLIFWLKYNPLVIERTFNVMAWRLVSSKQRLWEFLEHTLKRHWWEIKKFELHLIVLERTLFKLTSQKWIIKTGEQLTEKTNGSCLFLSYAISVMSRYRFLNRNCQ